MIRKISRNPLIGFFVMVFIVEWAVVLVLVPLSPMAVGLIAFVPTPVALLVTSRLESRKGLGALLRHSLAWRASSKWYAVAILVPMAVHLLAAVVALSVGARLAPRLEVFLVYLPLTLVLAIGEEIGWQGFAMPRLRMVFSPFSSALIFGVLHASFHLPMYLLPLPAELRQASPLGLFVLMVTAFALYRVWLFEYTGGNIPLIVAHHTAINTSVLLLNGVDSRLLGWILPSTWAVAALFLLIVWGFRGPIGNVNRFAGSDVRYLMGEQQDQ